MGSSSIVNQVSMLAVMALIAVLAISFGVVLLTPVPKAPLMTIEQALAALQSPQDAAALKFDRLVAAGPPEGRDIAPVSAAIAEALRIDPARVRTVWRADPDTSRDDAIGQTVTRIAGQDVVVNSAQGEFTMNWGAGVMPSRRARVPSFGAAVERPDGRWLTVIPKNWRLAAWKERMLLAFLLGGLILAPLTLLVGLRLTRPIRDLAEAAGASHLDRQEPIAISGPREIRAAAEAMNSMRARLLEHSAQRTRMLAAVAHDLRNPLTSLRVRAEAARPPERERMIADIERMTAMIAQVLDYSKSVQAGPQPALLDLALLVEASVHDAQDVGANAAIAELQAPLMVRADATGIRRAIDNLLNNAVRYGGNARVSAILKRDEAIVLVDDDGPGIPAPEFARLMEPFERLEGSRCRETGGTGLGLAIAMNEITANGGQLELANRPEGGLRAQLTFPLRASGQWKKQRRMRG